MPPSAPAPSPRSAQGRAPALFIAGGAIAGALVGGGISLASSTLPLPLMALCLGLIGGLTSALLMARAGLQAAELEAEEARVQADAALERDRVFFERISQEFRTPLTLIMAGFRALQDERDAPLRVRRELASAGLRNAARLLLVLYELGSLASLEPGRRPLRRRAVDLAALTRRVADNFSASGAGRRLEREGLDQVQSAEIDPHQIQTALYSLLAGAFERTDPVTGLIRLRLRAEAQRVVLELEDNGATPSADPGLDPTVTARGGAGLGLAVIREIVSAHQGELAAEAGPQGLRVRISLPRGDARATPAPFLEESTEVVDFLQRLASEPAAAEDAPTEEREAPLDPDRPIVLVALANRDLRAWITRSLRARYAVVPATSVATARARAMEVRPELIIADAEQGGSSFVAEIRRDPVLCATPILALLDNPASRDSADGDGLSADDYLPLPFEADELQARVAGLLRSRSQAEENAQLKRQLSAKLEEQIRELIRKGELRRYLPQALLEGALRRPADEDDEEPELDRRWITAVCCVLHGFGDLTERMAPDDLARLLNTWSRDLAAEANLHGGVVDQLQGDTVVVFFGVPEATKPAEQAAAALKLALSARQRTRALAEHWHRYGLPRELDLRTGIHTGVSLVGVLGSELTSRYTAFGPAVSAATRLAAEASNPGLLVTLATYAHVRSVVDATQAGTLSVDGLSRPVELYAVRGFKEGSKP